jgi:hypothetical protein
MVNQQHEIACWENEGGAACHPPPTTHCARVQQRIVRHLHKQDHPAVIEGLNLAIELCDAIVRDILAEMTARGKPTRGGQEQAAVARRCSKAIGLARDSA